MVSAIIFAQLWGVVQLIVLTTLARTVRVRTVFAAMAVGFYLIGPLTAFIQLSWIHLAAPLFGLSPGNLQAIAAYTVDPFIEETMKLLPLALLMLLPSIRRQWSLTDCVLVAAATGSGFGLTEHLFRYAAYPHTAYGVSGGWLLWAGMSKVFIPGVFHTLSSWITNGAYNLDNPLDINWHLAWSAIGGLAVGLAVRRRGRKALLTAAALFLLIGLDHAAGNAPRIEATWLAPLAGMFHLVTVGLGFWVLAALIAAWWLDQPAQRAGMALGPLLSAEQTASSAPVGTFTAALRRFPWSLPWVYGFDRERRAFHAAHATAVEGRETMFAALAARRDALEQQLNATGMPSLRPAWMTKDALQRELRSALRRPPVIIWLVLITPSVLFLIVGGFPQTAWLQRVLTAPVIWPLVLLITVAGQARIALRVFDGIKRLPTTARLPIGDDAAVLSLQLACGIGSVTLGAFTVERVLSGIGAREHLLSSAHASDAVLRATPGSIAATAGSAGTAAGPSSSGSPVGGSSGGFPSWGGNAGNSISSIGRSGGNPSPLPRVPPGVDPPAPNPNPLPPPPPLPPGDPANFPQPPPADVPAEMPTERVSPPAPNPNPLPPPPPPDPTPPPEMSVNDLPDAPDPPDPLGENPAEPTPPPAPPDGPEPPFDSAEETPQSPEESEAEDANDQVSPDNDAAEDTPPAPKPLTPQQLADQAAERAAQAELDAAAARQAAKAASDADDSAWIKAQTDPASDPTVAAAQARAKAAAEAAAAASDKAAQGEDPLDPIKNQEAASDAKRAAIDAAQDAQDAENKVQEQNQEAADAAKAAAQQAADAAAAADARAAAARDAASTAQANADAAAAKAANDAARAADPAQAAADDAQKALAAAQKSENDAFFGFNNSQAYHDARAALDAARAKADAAQAAADAAHDKSGSDSTVTSRWKP
jgi:hypothetical protein